MNFSLADMNYTADYWGYNYTEYFYEDDYANYTQLSNYSKRIIFSFVFIICCIGVPLNVMVIWLLGFQIKRNAFTVLILNLAIADFGFLIFMAIFCIPKFIYLLQSQIPWEIFFSLSNFTYINGLFLRTAISIDRCVCVLFPIWHRCSRPKYLSSAVCAFLWIFSFLLNGMDHIIHYSFLHNKDWDIHLIVTAVICLPLITISTVILFLKIRLQSKQMKRGRLFMMILMALLCFLIFTLPLYIYVLITHVLKKNNLFDADELKSYLNLTASLNSSVNPVIYFLVGRKKRAQTRESIKVIFQRVFKEDEAHEI